MEIDQKKLLIGRETGLAGPAERFTVDKGDLRIEIEHNKAHRSIHMSYSRPLSEKEKVFFAYLAYVLTGDLGILPNDLYEY